MVLGLCRGAPHSFLLGRLYLDRAWGRSRARIEASPQVSWARIIISPSPPATVWADFFIVTCTFHPTSQCPVLTGGRLASPPHTGLGDWWALQEIMGNHMPLKAIASLPKPAVSFQTPLLSWRLGS